MARRCLPSCDLPLRSLFVLRVAQSRIKRNSVAVHVELSHDGAKKTEFPTGGNRSPRATNESESKETRSQRAVTVTGSIVNPDELPLITMLPAAPVDRTIASTLPLNALRLVPLYDDVSTGCPLSTPTSCPAPETVKLTEFSAFATIAPFASRTSPVMNTRSRPSALMVVRSADSATRAA